MNILVTGGAGFIGSHLSERLLREGHRVIVLDNFDDFYDPRRKRKNLERLGSHPGFRLYEGDLRDEAFLNRLFSVETVEIVAHLAARAGVRPSIRFPALYADVNIRGTFNLLEACRHHAVGRVVFASSSSVYGNNPKVPFSETDNVDNPISPYAATKKAGELIAYTYHHLYGLNIACLRYFTVYGPRQRPEMAIHKFTRLIHQGKKLSLFGDGSSRRDYTFVEDAVEGTVNALQRSHGYQIYNIGESQTTSLRELVRLIEDRLGKKAVVEHLPTQPGDVDWTFADIQKAREELGYNPKTDMPTGLKKFVEWYVEEQKTF
jgi:UDP-glucuronate 4-epimerase